MKKILIILVVAAALFSFKAQLKAVIYAFDFKVDYFDIDILGNIYVVHDSELALSNQKGEIKAVFSNSILGEISSIDASDAMNILVFYQDFAKLLFLDNTLSLKKSVIDLSDLGFPNASLACLSYNNAFWIFDPVNQELVRINQFLDIVERSGNLNQIIDTEIDPDQLIEAGNMVYLKDKNKGIFIFDGYAAYQKRMPFINVDDVQIIAPELMAFLKNDTVFTYNMLRLNSDTLPINANEVKQMFIKNNRIHYLNKKGDLASIEISSIKHD